MNSILFSYFSDIKTLIIICLIAFCIIEVQGQKTFPITCTFNSPVIDGLLSTGEWDTSFFAGGFIQMEPDKGQGASELTMVYAAFDSSFVYFAFVCRQGNKTPVTANIQTRDRVRGSDDAVIVILDTYLDRRSACGFTVNPLGTQTDYKIMDDGRNINYEWDTEWQSAAVINETGWVCELAIPFKSLKYRASKDEWGLNFGRVIVRNSEIAWWSGEMADNYRISQGGLLREIIVPSKPERFMLSPYASLRYENSDITGVHNKIKPDAGGDVLYNISPNLSLNATINPDFASVEGDRVKIDLSGWEVNFPEKRLFFLEGNEMFSMRYQPFYSRRIGDIGYGLKFTGKAGDYSMNVLNVRSIENLDEGQHAAFYSTARVKKDIFKSSTIGAILVDKSDFDTVFSRSFGIDWILNPGERWKISGQLLGSYPGKLIDHSGGFIRVANETNKYHVHLRYTVLGENLKDNINQTGFLRDDDRHELDADLNYTFWMQNSFIRYIRVSFANKAYWSIKRELRGWTIRDQLRIYLTNKLSYQLYYSTGYQKRDTDDENGNPISLDFYNYFYENELGYNTDASANVSLAYTFGRNFNRQMKILSGSLSTQPLNKLNLRYSVSWLNFEPDTIAYSNIRLEHSTLLNILTVDYYFTNNLWLRLFAQHNTYNEKVYLYGQFGWRFKPPFGAVYLIYAGDNFYNHEDKLYYDHKTIFLKFTYPIRW
ncbi:hypothetical protein ES708_22862 [subsurface metagenome]